MVALASNPVSASVASLTIPDPGRGAAAAHTPRVGDWNAIARRQEERAEGAQGAVLRGNASYGAGLAYLMLGDAERAAKWLDRAVEAYRESWAEARPDSWGRPIGAMKARLIAGRAADEEARWAFDAGAAEAESPIGRYVAAHVCLVLVEDEHARVDSDGLR